MADPDGQAVLTLGRCCRVWLPDLALQAGQILKTALVGENWANLTHLRKLYPGAKIAVNGEASHLLQPDQKLHVAVMCKDRSTMDRVATDVADLAETAIDLVADDLGWDEDKIQEAFKGIRVEKFALRVERYEQDQASSPGVNAGVSETIDVDLEPVPEEEWECPKCSQVNEMSEAMCAACGGKQPSALKAKASSSGVSVGSQAHTSTPITPITPAVDFEAVDDDQSVAEQKQPIDGVGGKLEESGSKPPAQEPKKLSPLDALKAALKNKDVRSLRSALQECEAHGFDGGDDVEEAKKMLALEKERSAARGLLIEACQRRDPDDIREALEDALTFGLADADLQLARRLLLELDPDGEVPEALSASAPDTEKLAPPAGAPVEAAPVEPQHTRADHFGSTGSAASTAQPQWEQGRADNTTSSDLLGGTAADHWGKDKPDQQEEKKQTMRQWDPATGEYIEEEVLPEMFLRDGKKVTRQWDPATGEYVEEELPPEFQGGEEKKVTMRQWDPATGQYVEEEIPSDIQVGTAASTASQPDSGAHAGHSDTSGRPASTNQPTWEYWASDRDMANAWASNTSAGQNQWDWWSAGNKAPKDDWWAKGNSAQEERSAAWSSTPAGAASEPMSAMPGLDAQAVAMQQAKAPPLQKAAPTAWNNASASSPQQPGSAWMRPMGRPNGEPFGASGPMGPPGQNQSTWFTSPSAMNGESPQSQSWLPQNGFQNPQPSMGPGQPAMSQQTPLGQQGWMPQQLPQAVHTPAWQHQGSTQQQAPQAVHTPAWQHQGSMQQQPPQAAQTPAWQHQGSMQQPQAVQTPAWPHQGSMQQQPPQTLQTPAWQQQGPMQHQTMAPQYLRPPPHAFAQNQQVSPPPYMAPMQPQPTMPQQSHMPQQMPHQMPTQQHTLMQPPVPPPPGPPPPRPGPNISMPEASSTLAAEKKDPGSPERPVGAEGSLSALLRGASQFRPPQQAQSAMYVASRCSSCGRVSMVNSGDNTQPEKALCSVCTQAAPPAAPESSQSQEQAKKQAEELAKTAHGSVLVSSEHAQVQAQAKDHVEDDPKSTQSAAQDVEGAKSKDSPVKHSIENLPGLEELQRVRAESSKRLSEAQVSADDKSKRQAEQNDDGKGKTSAKEEVERRQRIAKQKIEQKYQTATQKGRSANQQPEENNAPDREKPGATPVAVRSGNEQSSLPKDPPKGILDARSPQEWYGWKSAWEIPPPPNNWISILYRSTMSSDITTHAYSIGVFDGIEEVWRVSVTHPCVVFGSRLQSAHIADLTDDSVKVQHAALLLGSSGHFSLEPINGKVRLSPVSAHPGVARHVVNSGRAVPHSEEEAIDLPVGSSRKVLSPGRCCFQLARSRLVFFFDCLGPSANAGDESERMPRRASRSPRQRAEQASSQRPRQRTPSQSRRDAKPDMRSHRSRSRRRPQPVAERKARSQSRSKPRRFGRRSPSSRSRPPAATKGRARSRSFSDSRRHSRNKERSRSRSRPPPPKPRARPRSPSAPRRAPARKREQSRSQQRGSAAKGRARSRSLSKARAAPRSSRQSRSPPGSASVAKAKRSASPPVRRDPTPPGGAGREPPEDEEAQERRWRDEENAWRTDIAAPQPRKRGSQDKEAKDKDEKEEKPREKEKRENGKDLQKEVPKARQRNQERAGSRERSKNSRDKDASRGKESRRNDQHKSTEVKKTGSKGEQEKTRSSNKSDQRQRKRSRSRS